MFRPLWLCPPFVAVLFASCILPNDFHKTDAAEPSDGSVGGSGGGELTKSATSSGGASSTAPPAAGAAGQRGCQDDADCLDEEGVCDGVDRCVAGECQEGEPPECVAKDVCHEASCDPVVGCTSELTGESDDLSDEDGDGFAACIDCDDDDDEINPDADETVADGVDQNCDGRELCYQDLDDDGALGETTAESDDLDCGGTSDALPMVPDDCDDTQQCTRPGQAEFCNGIDDDCDGQVDEFCRELLSAGSHHTCALRGDGAAECWGTRDHGEPENQYAAFSTLATGTDAVCAVGQDLVATCWGGAEAADYLEPPLGVFTAISADEFHACGLRPYRSIECWGEDGLGQSTPPEGLFDAVSVGRLHSCGIRDDGDIECWGNQSTNAAGTHQGPFVNVSAGDDHTCAVREDGSVECWGLNDVGQAEPPSGEFLTVSAGRYHSCGLRRDFGVSCWGEDSAGQSSAPSGEFAAVSVGRAHSCALRANGEIECWGSNLDGQSEVPTLTFATGGTCGPVTDPNQIGPLRVANVYLRPDCSPQCMADAEHVTDWGVVRSFDYKIPAGNQILDVVASGTWGYPGVELSSAPAEVRVEDVLVAECLEGTPCWDAPDDTLVSWSFSFNDAEIDGFRSLFSDGHADLTVFQTARWAVTMHDIDLTIYTEPGSASSE